MEPALRPDDVEALASCVEQADAENQRAELDALRARGRSVAVVIESSPQIRAARQAIAALRSILPPSR